MTIQGQKFSVEIELAGITRSQAAQTISEYFGATYEHRPAMGYDTYAAFDTSKPYSS